MLRDRPTADFRDEALDTPSWVLIRVLPLAEFIEGLRRVYKGGDPMIHTVYFAYASIKQFRIHISHSRTLWRIFD